jgi:hypothetical protein
MEKGRGKGETYHVSQSFNERLWLFLVLKGKRKMKKGRENVKKTEESTGIVE